MGSFEHFSSHVLFNKTSRILIAIRGSSSEPEKKTNIRVYCISNARMERNGIRTRAVLLDD